jgi:SAM-dependent methyltransferase
MDPACNTDTKNATKESQYWNDFYANKFDLIGVPSQFCVMLATEADKSRPIVEFGCGNGRDSIYLARQGFKVFATDLSAEAISHNSEKEGGPEKNMDFNVCDVSVPEDVQAVVNKARGEQGGKLNLYNRFFLHSLDDEQERVFLTALASATLPGDCLYMEFRCSLDAKLDKLFKGHFRRYVDTGKLVTMLEEKLEFNVTYETTGQGMAKYKHEDPFVSRIIAERR